MKKLSIVLSAIVVGLCFSFTCVGTIQAKQVYELSFVNDYPERHPVIVNVIKPWIKSIEEKTNGRLKIVYYPPNTLGSLKDGYDSLITGMYDMLAISWNFNQERFPEQAVMTLPFIASSAEAGGLIVRDLRMKYPEMQNRFKDTILLWQWTGATNQLNTTKKQVKNLEDFKGLRMIGPSPDSLEMIKMLGANPIEMSPHDTYMALQRNIADGVVLPLAPIKAFKISDVTKHHTIIDMYVAPFFAIINKQRFGSLPSDLQNILIETTGEKMNIACGRALDHGSVKDAKWMKEQGHTFFSLPEAERQRWIERLKPYTDAKIKKMEDMGVGNARKMYEDAVLLGKKYAKTTGKGYSE